MGVIWRREKTGDEKERKKKEYDDEEMMICDVLFEKVHIVLYYYARVYSLLYNGVV